MILKIPKKYIVVLFGVEYCHVLGGGKSSLIDELLFEDLQLVARNAFSNDLYSAKSYVPTSDFRLASQAISPGSTPDSFRR